MRPSYLSHIAFTLDSLPGMPLFTLDPKQLDALNVLLPCKRIVLWNQQCSGDTEWAPYQATSHVADLDGATFAHHMAATPGDHLICSSKADAASTSAIQRIQANHWTRRSTCVHSTY